MSTDDNHKYTFHGFDGPYWDRKSRKLEAELEARTEPGDRAVSWTSTPDRLEKTDLGQDAYEATIYNYTLIERVPIKPQAKLGDPLE